MPKLRFQFFTYSSRDQSVSVHPFVVDTDQLPLNQRLNWLCLLDADDEPLQLVWDGSALLFRKIRSPLDRKTGLFKKEGLEEKIYQINLDLVGDIDFSMKSSIEQELSVKVDQELPLPWNVNINEFLRRSWRGYPYKASLLDELKSKLPNFLIRLNDRIQGGHRLFPVQIERALSYFEDISFRLQDLNRFLKNSMEGFLYSGEEFKRALEDQKEQYQQWKEDLETILRSQVDFKETTILTVDEISSWVAYYELATKPLFREFPTEGRSGRRIQIPIGGLEQVEVFFRKGDSKAERSIDRYPAFVATRLRVESSENQRKVAVLMAMNYIYLSPDFPVTSPVFVRGYGHPLLQKILLLSGLSARLPPDIQEEKIQSVPADIKEALYQDVTYRLTDRPVQLQELFKNAHHRDRRETVELAQLIFQFVKNHPAMRERLTAVLELEGKSESKEDEKSFPELVLREKESLEKPFREEVEEEKAEEEVEERLLVRRGQKSETARLIKEKRPTISPD